MRAETLLYTARCRLIYLRNDRLCESEREGLGHPLLTAHNIKLRGRPESDTARLESAFGGVLLHIQQHQAPLLKAGPNCKPPSLVSCLKTGSSTELQKDPVNAQVCLGACDNVASVSPSPHERVSPSVSPSTSPNLSIHQITVRGEALFSLDQAELSAQPCPQKIGGFRTENTGKSLFFEFLGVLCPGRPCARYEMRPDDDKIASKLSLRS